jgi:hypothetical protein
MRFVIRNALPLTVVVLVAASIGAIGAAGASCTTR